MSLFCSNDDYCNTVFDSAIEAVGGKANGNGSSSMGIDVGVYHSSKDQPALSIKGSTVFAYSNETGGQGTEGIGVGAYWYDNNNDYDKGRVIMEDDTALLLAHGYTQAIKGKISNKVVGLGWSDYAGTGEGTLIPANPSAVALNYKRVKIPPAFPPMVAQKDVITGNVIYGAEGNRTISIDNGTLPGETQTFQWYSNTTNSNTGGRPIQGATGQSYTIPLYEPVGTHYYYCEVTSTFSQYSAKTVSETFTVNIIYMDRTISLNKKGSQTMVEGSTLRLVPDFAIKEGTWKSNNPKAVSVDKNGVVTILNKGGRATITVKTADGKKKASFVIKAATMKIRKNNRNLEPGTARKAVSVILYNDSIAGVASNNENVATATFKKKTVYIKVGNNEGNAVITVRSKLGMEKTINVNVSLKKKYSKAIDLYSANVGTADGDAAISSVYDGIYDKNGSKVNAASFIKMFRKIVGSSKLKGVFTLKYSGNDADHEETLQVKGVKTKPKTKVYRWDTAKLKWVKCTVTSADNEQVKFRLGKPAGEYIYAIVYEK